MGKIKDIFGPLKRILIDQDVVSSTDLSTNEQIDEINNSDSSEDIKKILGESLNNIKMEYEIKPFEVKHPIVNEAKIKNVKLNSIKNIEHVKEVIDNMDEKDR